MKKYSYEQFYSENRTQDQISRIILAKMNLRKPYFWIKYRFNYIPK